MNGRISWSKWAWIRNSLCVVCVLTFPVWIEKSVSDKLVAFTRFDYNGQVQISHKEFINVNVLARQLKKNPEGSSAWSEFRFPTLASDQGGRAVRLGNGGGRTKGVTEQHLI